MTLDAGGTNFVFSAVREYKEAVAPVCLPAAPDKLDVCLSTLVKGFGLIKKRLKEAPAAISFAFPGPADYKNGVIGDLPNFPAFRGGVALGPYLEDKFGIPVFINNDGNLFAYGEALAGALPAVNERLAAQGNPKRYKNLLGVTLGTGFGAGVVIDDRLLTGDNGCGGDVWMMRNKKYPHLIAEESVSIRAVRRVYAGLSGEDTTGLTPEDIYTIAEGLRRGNRAAAVKSFEELGEAAGAAIVQALQIVDGLVVVGGGLAGAARYILPAVVKEMKRSVYTFSGREFPCLPTHVYNLADPEDCEKFMKNTPVYLPVPFSGATGQEVRYDRDKCIGITVSSLGASKAIALGAYAFALQRIGCILQADIFPERERENPGAGSSALFKRLW